MNNLRYQSAANQPPSPLQRLVLRALFRGSTLALVIVGRPATTE